jgi:hypothetical protein
MARVIHNRTGPFQPKQIRVIGANQEGEHRGHAERAVDTQGICTRLPPPLARMASIHQE